LIGGLILETNKNLQMKKNLTQSE